MRKQEKVIIWPVYFDANKTRKEGRRVAKTLAVPAPKITEIDDASIRLDLSHELILEKGYPRTPWNKVGMVLIEKKGTKEQVINGIAKQLLKIRREASS